VKVEAYGSGMGVRVMGYARATVKLKNSNTRHTLSRLRDFTRAPLPQGKIGRLPQPEWLGSATMLPPPLSPPRAKYARWPVVLVLGAACG
jgi:hypothetical protein